MDKPIPITTLAAAKALPLVRNAMFDIKRTMVESGPNRGDTVETLTPRKIVLVPANKNQVLFFSDGGKQYQVIYTEDGPAKAEVRY